MNYESLNILALMSGTSCDGVDLAYVSFNLNNSEWNYRFNISETIPYPDHWKKWLPIAHNLPLSSVQKADVNYTKFLAKTINTFIDKHNLTAIDYIASHGHTIFHQPESAFTLQIGNKPELAQLTNLPVICDFRVEDVNIGGQGAPLVPIGDRLLFSAYKACINLGGFANISYEVNNQRIAFDICPVNIVLNPLAQKLGCDYDENGKIAANGSVNSTLLNHLNRIDFYQQQPPKSLGIEWVNQNIMPLLNSTNSSTVDLISTYTQHVTDQIARVINALPSGKVLFTGGGTYNNQLIKSIRAKTNQELVIPNDNLINYKEALIFGLLGILKLRGEINVLKSVTGAKTDHCAGFIYYPSTKI